jgi:hypothetical protein
MAFLLKNGAVFLHVPKTGGTWIKHVMEKMDLIQAPLGHQHADWERSFWHDKLHRDLKVARYLVRRAVRSRKAQPRLEQGCFRFCFVREPLSWYESYWRFMESKNWDWEAWGHDEDHYQWHPCAMVNSLGSHDFNEFIHRVNKKRPGFVTEMYGWYVRPGIGFVGRQEFLRHDLINAFTLMKIDFKADEIMSMKRSNETPCAVPKPEWDPALKKLTLQFEHAGYVRYGYPIKGIWPKDIARNGESPLLTHSRGND